MLELKEEVRGGALLPTPCPSDRHPYNNFNFFLNLIFHTFEEKSKVWRKN